MMIQSENRIIFEHEGDYFVPDVIGPSYMYKVGDRIKITYLNDKAEETVEEFEVVDIKHEVDATIISNQIARVYLHRC